MIMTYLYLSYKARDTLFMIVMGLVLIVIGLAVFASSRRSRELKKHCTVPVEAVCILKKERENKYQRYNSFNCTYQYKYKDRVYTANNGVWGPRRAGYGETVRLMIDPNDPENEIFDPVAKGNITSAYIVFVVFAGMGGSMIIAQILRDMGII